MGVTISSSNKGVIDKVNSLTTQENNNSAAIKSKTDLIGAANTVNAGTGTLFDYLKKLDSISYKLQRRAYYTNATPTADTFYDVVSVTGKGKIHLIGIYIGDLVQYGRLNLVIDGSTFIEVIGDPTIDDAMNNLLITQNSYEGQLPLNINFNSSFKVQIANARSGAIDCSVLYSLV